MRQRGKAKIFITVYILVTLALSLICGAHTWRQEGSLTAMCLSWEFPQVDFPQSSKTLSGQETEAASRQVKTATDRAKSEEKEAVTGTSFYGTNLKKRVLIVHTHATESYMPASSGNFHRIQKSDTVREVGDALAQTLESNGIGVVHSQVLHDNPSYNASYSRSGQTIKMLLARYPDIECVIDLHRDAIGSAIDGATARAGGKTCATYSYVISNTCATYSKNKGFVQKLNSVAAAKYNGFTGKVLERPYWYNQELFSPSILLEVGNNRNDISEAVHTARVFGKVLSKVLR